MGTQPNTGTERMFRTPSAVAWMALGIIVLLMTTTGCQTNPYTGRWQLMMVPMSQEVQMGVQAYSQVQHDPKLKPSTDPREIDPVKRVAARVIEAAKHSKYSEIANQFEWEVTVIKDDKTMNAFALPGGKIAVYTGIFPVAKTEAGLAAVMGHEVVHALARHGGERMSQNTLAQTTLQAIGIGLGISGANPVLSQAGMAALGVGTQVGVLLPFSRKHESEADYVGVLFAAEAGLAATGGAIRSLLADAGVPALLAEHGVRAAERAGRLRVSFHVNNTAEEVARVGRLLRGHVSA